MSEVEETLKRINSHKGVQGIVIVNQDCIPIRSTLDDKTSKMVSSDIVHLCSRARSAVRSLDPQNDLTFLRIRSKKYEILVAPDKVRRPPPPEPGPSLPEQTRAARRLCARACHRAARERELDTSGGGRRRPRGAYSGGGASSGGGSTAAAAEPLGGACAHTHDRPRGVEAELSSSLRVRAASQDFHLVVVQNPNAEQ